MEFDDLIGKVLEREGGYVNRKNDRGGPTNFGITQRTLDDWAASHAGKWGASRVDVKNLSRDDAVGIYYDRYWTPAKCQALPDRVRNIHFDAAVNHGVTRAIMMLQSAAGAATDGVFGPATLRAVCTINQDLLLMRYIAMRYRFYGQIIQRDKSQLEFIVGWMRRMEEFA